MDVRIGVTYTGKELDIDLGDDADADAVQADVDAAIGGTTSVLWLTDKKGRRLGIPTDKLAYVEIGSSDAERRIGFAT
ncbi:DUF3107 domain-containing protein [Actinospongicola halichondriae]|uniref:DUF3107 domain-containing protein n=1 Tax=Actinospongicola halichondriae TaxID=3236844 RepID=UPI003D410D58